MPVADSMSFMKKACSVMLKGFDERPDIFYSITLKFNDRTIALNEHRDDIDNAIKFNDWLTAFYRNSTDSTGIWF